MLAAGLHAKPFNLTSATQVSVREHEYNLVRSMGRKTSSSTETEGSEVFVTRAEICYADVLEQVRVRSEAGRKNEEEGEACQEGRLAHATSLLLLLLLPLLKTCLVGREGDTEREREMKVFIRGEGVM